MLGAHTCVFVLPHVTLGTTCTVYFFFVSPFSFMFLFLFVHQCLRCACALQP
eukprot:m.29625 g.29625  ORF g.29625 m.29625 type:complete len:52 (-) comp9188_c0_seq2:199-354(-)